MYHKVTRLKRNTKYMFIASSLLVGCENNSKVRTITKMDDQSLINRTARSGNSMSKNNSVIISESSNANENHKEHNQEHHKYSTQKSRSSQGYLHLNSLWSIWYGILMTLFQGYLAIYGAYRFLGYSLIQWEIEPIFEMNIQIIACGIALTLLPLFFASTLFQVGNLANDGMKLGNNANNTCSISKHDMEEKEKNSLLGILWTHGGPTSAFFHIVIAICLLIPKLILEARIIENGLLPRENIWKSDLDFLSINPKSLAALSSLPLTYQNISNNTTNEASTMLKAINNIYKKEKIDHKYKITYPGISRYYNSDLNDKYYPEEKIISSHKNMKSDIYLTKVTPSIKSLTSFTTSDIVIRASKTVAITTPSVILTTRLTEPVQLNDANRTNFYKQNKKHLSKMKEKIISQEKQHYSKEQTNENLNVFSKEDFENSEVNDKKTFEFNDEFGVSKIFENDAPSKVKSNSTKLSISTISPFSITYKKPTTKSILKDSHIHILKPEKLPIIIPATSISTNSKIIEIKSNTRVKRVTKRELNEFDPMYEAVPNSFSNLTSLIKLNGFSRMLQNLFGVEEKIDITSFLHSSSMEFLNLILALIVWSVRYPAVFWATTKPFSTIFSIQMVSNMIDIILNYVGVSILYKLQINGEILQIQMSGLVLNATVTLSLFVVSTILVLSSSLIVYLYGYNRLATRIRNRCVITVKNNEIWLYFGHCASLCFVIALVVVKTLLIHDLIATYRFCSDRTILLSALESVVHLFLWTVLWLGISAKRRWNFNLPSDEQYGLNLRTNKPHFITTCSHNEDVKCISSTTSSCADGADDTIYWPKLTSNSPKLKVTFNEVTSTSEDGGKHDIKCNRMHRVVLCISNVTGETNNADSAILQNEINHKFSKNDDIKYNEDDKILHSNEYNELSSPLLPQNHVGKQIDDNTSEEGKLLAFVRDDSVTYASTKDLEPPHLLHSSSIIQSSPIQSATVQIESSEHLFNQLAPMNITVESNEVHIVSSSTPQRLQRADSGVPNEILTPRSDTTSTTESTISPPERVPSETSSGIHSTEEREEVVIRPRVIFKPPSKPTQPVIQEEPFSRSTNMKMSSFNNEGKSSATLPLPKNLPEKRSDYSHCNTMPLPLGCHQQFKPETATPSNSKQQPLHTTLPNRIRHSNPQILRRTSYATKIESPYGHFNPDPRHHTFSKLLHDPFNDPATSIPKNRSSENYLIYQGKNITHTNA